jgi:RNA polymerase sigma factor (sigma-70 family)
LATTIEEQIGTLFRENRAAMEKIAYRITARRDYPLEGRKDAEDVVQNVFLHLLEKGTPEQVIRNPKGYLHQCTVNEAISLVRARKRVPVDLGKKWAEIPIPAPGMGTDEGMLLQEALAELDGRQAAILRLHDHDGYSNSDIAKMYGMKEPAVRQIVSRGRAEVRRFLSDSNTSLTGQKGGRKGNEYNCKEDQGVSRFRENGGCGVPEGTGFSTEGHDEQFGVSQPAGRADGFQVGDRQLLGAGY